MRLTDEQSQVISQLARELIGERCSVRVFGSRLDDARVGVMSIYYWN